jgi:outer membrane protein insertion porin family
MKRMWKGLFLILGLVLTTGLRAQQDTVLPFIDYDLPKSYEVGQISVTGTFNSDANALIGVTGLKSGSKINIPGPEIQKAIRALWNLKLFTQVEIIQARVADHIVDLEIRLLERPRLARYSYTGIKKLYHEDLNEKLKRFINRNDVVTENKKQTAVNEIKQFFKDKGFYDVGVKVLEKRDTKMRNGLVLEFDVSPNDRVKIDQIIFEGNQLVSDKKLRGKLSETKQKGKIFGKSKLVKEDLEKDKVKVIQYYNTVGFRDARFIRDSIWRNEDGTLNLKLVVEEGPRFYIGDITWKGNSIHDEQQLNAYLGIR